MQRLCVHSFIHSCHSIICLSHANLSSNNFFYHISQVRERLKVATAAVLRHGEALEWCSEALRGDPRLQGLQRCHRNGLALSELLPASLRSDNDVARVAVRQNWRAVRFVGADLRADPKFMTEVGEWAST